jgi:hypothetical protein
LNSFTLTFRALGRNHFASTLTFQPSQSYVLIRQSDSSCPYQFQVGAARRRGRPWSQSFSQSYGSNLPTSLIYIILSTRGCSPWRPDAVMGTTWLDIHVYFEHPWFFKGRQEGTGSSQNHYPPTRVGKQRKARLLHGNHQMLRRANRFHRWYNATESAHVLIRKENSSQASCRRHQVSLRRRLR